MEEMHLILEPIHLCRNRGGTDVSICSTDESNKYPKTGNFQKDLICGTNRTLVRYCHISGLNDPTYGVYYNFTPYTAFDSAAAHSVCNEVGGTLPNLETELDYFYFVDRMEFLLSFVSLGQPYSLKWMSWPVSTIIKISLIAFKLKT